MSNEKILFIYPNPASFIRLDKSILSERYRVVENTYNWRSKPLIPLHLLRQLIFILSNIRGAKAILISFGGYWALLPSLIGRWFNKPVYIILNGSDCVSFPILNYGNLRKPLLKKVIGISYARATLLLPVSESLIYTENTYVSRGKVLKQGVKYYFKSLKTPYHVIHNAINIEKFEIVSPGDRPKASFVSVIQTDQYELKGADLIIEAARDLPDCEFNIIGMTSPVHLDNIPANVVFHGYVPHDELSGLFNAYKYYLQLSCSEGFGVAVCEAMLCGCIPVVSNVNMLPEIVGDAGYVLEFRDSGILVQLIKSLLEEEHELMARRVRDRIVDRFTVTRRRQELFEVLA